jgi:redox-sensitive bicupin YhaK (pirin superfamily)
MLDAVIVPRTRDIGGGFMVRRALPAIERRSVGPFVFFDQMGPVALEPGKGLDVRPHPHIGLATVTYLFEGEILHRDSLGTVQPIRPGDVNWMTAGRGIVHSERTPPELRADGPRAYGIQLWVGLPRAHEEDAPSFAHTSASRLPMADENLRVILGEWRGARSPVQTLSPTFYADARIPSGETLQLDFPYAERAAYVAEGTIECEGRQFDAGQLLVFGSGGGAISAQGKARALLLGGEPLDGPRHLWWNFVSSSKDRLAQAAEDWRRFPVRGERFAAIPGETEFIPLPEKRIL